MAKIASEDVIDVGGDYWINPNGTVIPVDLHFDYLWKTFGPVKIKGFIPGHILRRGPWKSEHPINWAIDNGWIRISTYSVHSPLNVQGQRQQIRRRWNTIYDLAVKHRVKEIFIQYGDKNSYTSIAIEDAIEPPGLTAIANPEELPYGYWIDKTGKITEVDGPFEHDLILELLFPDSKTPSRILMQWVLQEGWIRIAIIGKFYNNQYVKEMNIQGQRASIRKRWNDLYDIAIRHGVRCIHIDWMESNQLYVETIAIEDAIEPPRIRVHANPEMPYGYWITNKGKVIPVMRGEDHQEISERYGIQRSKDIEDIGFDAVRANWIRIATDGPMPTSTSYVEGRIEPLRKYWNTVYDLSIGLRVKKLGLEIVDFRGRELSYKSYDIEDVEKFPARQFRAMNLEGEEEIDA